MSFAERCFDGGYAQDDESHDASTPQLVADLQVQVRELKAELAAANKRVTEEQGKRFDSEMSMDSMRRDMVDAINQARVHLGKNNLRAFKPTWAIESLGGQLKAANEAARDYERMYKDAATELVSELARGDDFRLEHNTLAAHVERLREALAKLMKHLDGTHQGSGVHVGMSWATSALSETPADEMVGNIR